MSINEPNSIENLDEVEMRVLFSELMNYWDFAESLLREWVYKNGKLTKNFFDSYVKPKLERISDSTQINKITANTPSVNGYLCEGLRLFSKAVQSSHKKIEWDYGYFSFLYKVFVNRWDIWEEYYDRMVKSFNTYGVRAKVWLWEFLAAINVYSYLYPRDSVDLDDIINKSIQAYIRVNGLVHAQKFYDNAEMMAFAEHTMNTDMVWEMFGSMDKITSSFISLSDTQSGIKQQWDKVSRLLKWQYEHMRRHARMAISYIDCIHTLWDISDDSTSSDDWQASWDLYLDYTDRKSRSFPWVTIDMKKQLGWKINNILHLRTIEDEESDYVALWNVRSIKMKAAWRKHLQNRLLTDGFFPTIEDEENGQKEIDYWNVYYGIPFWVKKTWEIEIYGWNYSYEQFGISSAQQGKLRAYILWYLAQLTNADYEVVSPRELTRDKKKTQSGKTPEIVTQMPWLRPVTKNPDVYPSRDQREIDYRSPHTRLLPTWWTPSATQYIQGQESNMALFAYVQNNNGWTIEEICRIDIDSEDNKYSYEEFLELCETIRKQYERWWWKVRFQTYVKKFDRSIIVDTRKIVAQVIWSNITVPGIK